MPNSALVKWPRFTFPVAVFAISTLIRFPYSYSSFSKAMEKAFEVRRRAMVERHIQARGIRDTNVLKSMLQVPRHYFVPESLREEAYEDCPLPIGYDQTISQPYIVAYMVEAAMITSNDKVLDVGSGCGYAAAVAANIAKSVDAVEIVPELARSSKETLKALGYDNVNVWTGDGSVGYPDGAPYDAILVAASAPAIPRSLKEQLATGGRLVLPVKGQYGSDLLERVTRLEDGSFREEVLEYVRFVPLLGEEGYTGRN